MVTNGTHTGVESVARDARRHIRAFPAAKRRRIGRDWRTGRCRRIAPVKNLHDFAGLSTIVAWEERYMPKTEERKYDGSVGVDVKDDEWVRHDGVRSDLARLRTC